MYNYKLMGSNCVYKEIKQSHNYLDNIYIIARILKLHLSKMPNKY